MYFVSEIHFDIRFINHVRSQSINLSLLYFLRKPEEIEITCHRSNNRYSISHLDKQILDYTISFFVREKV